MLKIIPFNQKYQAEVIELWNKTLVSDSISEKRFIQEILLEDNYDPDNNLIAIKNNRVVGYILATKRHFPYLDRGLEPHRAWINILFVDKEYQRSGIGTELLLRVESKLANEGASEFSIASYSPSYFFPGVDLASYENAIRFFEKNDYIHDGNAVSMTRELWDYSIPQKTLDHKIALAEKGYTFSKFSNIDSVELLMFLKENFGGGWKRNALMAMQSDEAENVIWVCKNIDKKIVGFCMRKMDGYDHRFGPFGVKESLRSEGIGGVLFELMMNDMKSQKIYQAYFLWTSGRGQKFYSNHEFKVYREYALMSKGR